MGIRFRKSVKICKGMKINFSKSGPSMSFGGRGHKLTVGGRGVRSTFGIPGTGLSYSTKIGGHHKSRSTSRRRTTSRAKTNTVAIPKQVQLKMDQNGKVEILDSKGLPILDQAVIRKIKATDYYRTTVQTLENQRQEQLTNAFNEAKAENDKFIEIYKLSPNVDKREKFVEVLNNLAPEVYVREEFDDPYPTEELIREELDLEAKENVQGNIFTVGKLRKDYINQNLQSRLTAAVSEWNQLKAEFEKEEDEFEISENERYKEEYAAYKQFYSNLIDGEDQAIGQAVEEWISTCELPVEINVDYDWNLDRHIMFLDVDLPEIEDIPENEVVQLASGNLKEKKKTQATLKQEYIDLVFGLAIFISANIFNLSPAINSIVISGYTQRRNKAGSLEDEYIYSIIFNRNIFETSVLEHVNPKVFCMRFANRCNITSGLLMKKIEPFEAVVQN